MTLVKGRDRPGADIHDGRNQLLKQTLITVVDRQCGLAKGLVISLLRSFRVAGDLVFGVEPFLAGFEVLVVRTLFEFRELTKRLSRNRSLTQEHIGCFAEPIGFNEELITEID